MYKILLTNGNEYTNMPLSAIAQLQRYGISAVYDMDAERWARLDEIEGLIQESMRIARRAR